MRAYHVTDAGEAIEIELQDSLLESLDAALVLDDQRGELWVLRGQLDVKKKFLVARTAANLNLAEGLRFRIRHVEPNERKKVIRSLITGKEPKLASIAEFTEKEESHPAIILPTAPKPLAPTVEPEREEPQRVPAAPVPVLEEEPRPVKETVAPLPQEISTFFESFTRLALFEHSVPKEELPPRFELEKRLQQYLKTFLDVLYT